MARALPNQTEPSDIELDSGNHRNPIVVLRTSPTSFHQVPRFYGDLSADSKDYADWLAELSKKNYSIDVTKKSAYNTWIRDYSPIKL